MTRQTISLPQWQYGDASIGIWGSSTASSTLSIAIDAGLISGGGAAFLRYLSPGVNDYATEAAWQSQRNASNSSLWFRMSTTAGGGSAGVGPDFTSAFETGGRFVFSVSGGEDYEFRIGEDMDADATEPYTWVFSTYAAHLRMRAFLTAVSGASGVCTLALSDEPEPGAVEAHVAAGLPELDAGALSETGQTITLPVREGGNANFSRWGDTDASSILSILIEPPYIVNGGAAYLRYLNLRASNYTQAQWQSSASSSTSSVQWYMASTANGNPLQQGPDFIDAFETGGGLRFAYAGVDYDFRIGVDLKRDINQRDPYVWEMRTYAAHLRLRSFINAVGGQAGATIFITTQDFPGDAAARLDAGAPGLTVSAVATAVPVVDAAASRTAGEPGLSATVAPSEITPGRPYLYIEHLSSAFGALDVTTPVSAVIRGITLDTGKDSVRSLNPPQPPQLSFEALLEGADFAEPPYRQGDTVALYAESSPLFRGLLAKPDYTLAPGGLLRGRMRAYGLIQLLQREISTGLYDQISVRDAIGHVLDAAGWPAAFRSIDTGGLGALLDWWWVDRQTAWAALEELINAAGPPAQWYMQGDGTLRVLGTAWVTTDDSPSIAVGGAGQPQPLENPREDDDYRDIINRVAVRRTVYELAATAAVWTAGEDIIVPAGGEVVDEIRFISPARGIVSPVLGTDYTLSQSGGGVSVSLSEIHAQDALLTITATQARTVRGLQVRGRALQRVSEVVIERNDVDSQSEFGVRFWRGRLPSGIAQLTAEGVAGNVINGYADGINSRSFSLLTNFSGRAEYESIIALRQLSPVELIIGDFEYNGRVRSIRWRWSDTRLTAELVVDQDAGLLQDGSGPFVLGTSMLDSNAYLWI